MSTDVTQETVGARLRQLREAAGLSQKGLADAAGVPVRTVQNVEQGKCWPTFPVAVAIVRALGVSLDSLAEAPSGGVPERKMGRRPKPREA